jgi:hypothetical protein
MIVDGVCELGELETSKVLSRTHEPTLFLVYTIL